MPFTDRNRVKVFPNDNPQSVYDSFLSDLGSGSEPDPKTERRKRVLEAIQENLDLLEPDALGEAQRNKFSTHRESYEFYKNILDSQVDDNGQFGRPNIGMTGRNEDAEDICKAQLRNLAMCMQANLTNVASFQFMSAQDESLKINFPSIRPYMGEFGSGDKLNYNETRSHVSSHNESSLFDSQTRWYNMMIAYLVNELSQRIDIANGGFLIDHTVILVMSEVEAATTSKKILEFTSSQVKTLRSKESRGLTAGVLECPTYT